MNTGLSEDRYRFRKVHGATGVGVFQRPRLLARAVGVRCQWAVVRCQSEWTFSKMGRSRSHLGKGWSIGKL